MALLKSLSIERERWLATSETFRSQMLTIIGDVLLSAAFLAYAGYFDQQLRQSLFSNWCSHLQQAAVQYRPDLARTEYLSNPDERLRWQANSLPTDDLCTENAIMLEVCGDDALRRGGRATWLKFGRILSFIHGYNLTILLSSLSGAD